MGLSYATKHTKGDPINVSNNNNSTLVTHLGVLARKAEKRRVFVCAFVYPHSFERVKKRARSASPPLIGESFLN